MFMENAGKASSNRVIAAVEQAREILLAALSGVSFGLFGDEESLTLLLSLESVGRVVDGARTLSTTDVLRRAEYLDATVPTGLVPTDLVPTDSAYADSVPTNSVPTDSVPTDSAPSETATAGAVSLARRLGCRSGVELVATLARLSRSEVRQRAALGKNAGERMLLGRPLAPTYPVVGQALQAGALGVEQARVIVAVLDGLRSSVIVEDLDRVERSLVASGSGAITPETVGLPGVGIAFAPELLRQQGIQWQARLAPDGTAPGEASPERRSWLRFGGQNNGGYSLNGWFTTLDRAIIGNVFDAYLSPSAARAVPGATPNPTPNPTPSSTPKSTPVPRAEVVFRKTEPIPRGSVQFYETEPTDPLQGVHTAGAQNGKMQNEAVQNEGMRAKREQGKGAQREGAQDEGTPGKGAQDEGVQVEGDDQNHIDENGAKEIDEGHVEGENERSDLVLTANPCPQEPDDSRSLDEKRAGIFRAVFEAAARHLGTPTMGGAPPTVLVHVNINDLLAGRGAGWIDGVDGPLSTKQVDELICSGGYQSTLFGHQGQVLNLGTTKRFFTAAQRRALAARDGGCIIPGCAVPPHLTQVHHVLPWRDGGPTNIDNAVLLCHAAHSSIDTSGWNIKMVHGRPWIRGPIIFDPTQTWRPAGNNRAATPAEKPSWQK